MLSDSGALSILATYFSTKDLVLKLFCSDITPAMGDTAETYNTYEAAGGSYSGVALTKASWTTASIAGIPTATYPEVLFVFTGSLTANPIVYGYYVVDSLGTLIFAENKNLPFTPSETGDYVAVNPLFTMSNGTPT